MTPNNRLPIHLLPVQNGGAPDSAEEEDDEERYIRNARDLARLVVTDTIFT